MFLIQLSADNDFEGVLKPSIETQWRDIISLLDPTHRKRLDFALFRYDLYWLVFYQHEHITK